MSPMERKYLIKFMYVALLYFARQPVLDKAEKLAEEIRLIFKEEING